MECCVEGSKRLLPSKCRTNQGKISPAKANSARIAASTMTAMAHPGRPPPPPPLPTPLLVVAAGSAVAAGVATGVATGVSVAMGVAVGVGVGVGVAGGGGGGGGVAVACIEDIGFRGSSGKKGFLVGVLRG